MDRLRALALLLLLAAPATAAVRLEVAPGPLDADAVKRTKAAAAALLETPQDAASAGGLGFEAASWKNDLAPAERQRLLSTLRALWGARLTVREDSLAPALAPAFLPPPSGFLARADTTRTRLEALPRPLDRSGQDKFYDGKDSGRGSAVLAGAGKSAFFPRGAAVPSALKRRAAPPPPAAASKAKPAISWKKAGVEMLKGAGRMIADVFTWKGLAIAAASIAIVTIAPVAIYGFLALGAVFSLWTIGKAVVRGRAAYKANDAEAFYGASREMGRGVLGLGLTVLGARHTPTNLRPHFPRTSGEWRAMAAACDDEPIIAVSLLRGKQKP